MSVHELHFGAHAQAMEHVSLRAEWMRTGNVGMLAEHCQVPLAIYSDNSIGLIKQRHELHAMYESFCATVRDMGPVDLHQEILHVSRNHQSRVAIKVRRIWTPRFGTPLAESIVYRMRVLPGTRGVLVEMIEILRDSADVRKEPAA